MSKVRCGITVSLDGYAAGPDQSMENPLGVGGEHLHDWFVELEIFNRVHGTDYGDVVNASTAVVEESLAGVGAKIMGRNMFGGGPGPWDPAWQGWWGEDPPFHVPVFVLTHHPREPLTLSDTTFTFVTDGPAAALERARAAAGDLDVTIDGGAATIQQYLTAGLVDELELHVAPILLGGGERLLDNVDPAITFEPLRAVHAPKVTHVKYRVGKVTPN